MESGSASQRSGLGGACICVKSLVLRPLSIRRKGSCIARWPDPMKQVRRLCERGAVNAVPEICSAYKP
jgi:hypothetical protein